MDLNGRRSNGRPHDLCCRCSCSHGSACRPRCNLLTGAGYHGHVCVHPHLQSTQCAEKRSAVFRNDVYGIQTDEDDEDEGDEADGGLCAGPSTCLETGIVSDSRWQSGILVVKHPTNKKRETCKRCLQKLQADLRAAGVRAAELKDTAGGAAKEPAVTASHGGAQTP